MNTLPQLDRGFPAFERAPARTLSRGNQATISLLVSPSNGHELVLKRFRPSPDVQTALREEVAALELLRQMVNNTQLRGWTIRIPAVVAVSEDPAGFVMTRVAGQPLDDLIQNGWTPPQELSEALAEVFRRYWQTSGRPLGDVNLSNLMCSPDRQELAIVDPGSPDATFELDQEVREFYPASRDLGCLLHQVLSTNVAVGLRRRSSASARLAFVQQVIFSCTPADVDRRAYVTEIGACAAAHLSRVTGGSVMRRTWRLAVRGVARRALAEELSRLGTVATCR